MTYLYSIIAEYGQWEDHSTVDMFLTTDEAESTVMLQKLADEIAGAYAEVRERMAFNGNNSFDNLLVSEAVADVARRGSWDDGITLALYKQPMNVVTSDSRELINRKSIAFVPGCYEEFIDLIEETGQTQVGITIYDVMAEPFEQEFEGWKHA